MRTPLEAPPPADRAGQPDTGKPPRRVRPVSLVALVAATYFMVSGGPFGLEDLIADAGYGRAVLALLVTPVVWSLPVAMAVGELAAAYPEEGGYYAWVRRALGPFWGVQEAWLSLAASFFDLAIYPTLFTRYLAQLWAPAAHPLVGIAVGVGLIAFATGLNLRGARATADASVVLGVALLSPFVALTLAAWLGPVVDPVRASAAATPPGSLSAGLAVAMWNYMGWDNASTIAGEVRDPGRTYPRTMWITIALVVGTYVIPVLAMAHTGLPAESWTSGSWALAGEKVGGSRLGTSIAVAGMVSSAGMLLALVMAYARLPLVLARDGFLPAWLGKTSATTGAPWVSLVVCGALYAACLGLGFKRLVELDVVIYGGSLALEFVALVVLRVKEPDTPRPYRVPGGVVGAAALGVVPMGLIVMSLVDAQKEEGGAWVVIALGVVVVTGLVLWAARGLGTPRVGARGVGPQ